MIKQIISEIENALVDTCQEVDKWFNKSEKLRTYKPKNGGWSIDEILEHIVLTSPFLLIIIRKGSDKALRNSQNLV